MRITLSIPDAVAYRFQAAVPPRQRSRLVTSLLESALTRHEDALAAACRAANRDKALDGEIEDWQAFDDGEAAHRRDDHATLASAPFMSFFFSHWMSIGKDWYLSTTEPFDYRDERERSA